jgi:RIO kinase 1
MALTACSFLNTPWAARTHGFFAFAWVRYVDVMTISTWRNDPMDDESYLDEVEYYEELFGPSRRERKAARKQSRRRAGQPPHAAEVARVAEPTGLEAGFDPTYQPARFEAGWLLSSLRSFYEQHLISDVLASIKGGKEASVYRCAADRTTGVGLLAAKVYRPRQFRNLRNDKMYRDGRAILTADGRPAKATDHRLMRAIGKKTATGVQVSHTSWLMYEYTTLERLRRFGAAVPTPYAVNDNALLMSYLGDERMAAPTLNGVRLPRSEARALFEEVLRNIELMLQHGLIHGDLSAYNILYWEGRITLIDFPQVTFSRTNTQAYTIFSRDVRRVCEYFARQGVRCAPDAIVADLWGRYAALDPHDAAADASAFMDSATYGADEEDLPESTTVA